MLGDDRPLEKELEQDRSEDERREVVHMDLVRILVEQAEDDEVDQRAGEIARERALPVGGPKCLGCLGWHQRCAVRIHIVPLRRVSTRSATGGPSSSWWTWSGREPSHRRPCRLHTEADTRRRR